ncbi:hypothetical protein [Massilia antarctica]|uniref:hypothetical protein n=1 Tax=Massilia antarctica TaxID=2765360 RepID=UPI0011AF3435|nr:hypothetical protein [Massilia sp. H27-R4]MCY0916204.1 hypothetical protein [Massilia sp. H27-R4]
MADGVGGVSLESTGGGRIMNGWERVNTSSIPEIKDGLWAGLSKNYAAGAEGGIKIVQSDPAFLNGGGYIWKTVELPEIIRQGKVTSATILDLSGNVRATLTFKELETMNLKHISALTK